MNNVILVLCSVLSLALSGCGGPNYYLVPSGMTQEQAVAALKAKEAAAVAAPTVVYVAAPVVYYPNPYFYHPYAGLPVMFGLGLGVNVRIGGHRR